MTPAEILTQLAERGHTLGFGESLTGGLLADRFIEVPGASRVIRGSVVAYATDAKRDLLDVPAELLAAQGAVDPQVAQRMAVGARSRFRATYGLSTTGVAGPDPQDGQAVGTVYIGLATPTSQEHTLVALSGSREEIRRGAVEAAVGVFASFLGGR